jgi:ureidoglycolate lyase
MESTVKRIRVQRLTREAYEPFGWVLGAPPDRQNQDYLEVRISTFWGEHIFDVGEGGAVQLVWVDYRWRGFGIEELESHRLTEQAFIPVAWSPMVQVVCPPPDDPMALEIVPDLSQMRAFLLDGTKGVCMKRGCWHTPLPLGDSATYLMITRHSTTTDILNGERSGADTVETVVVEVSDLTDTVFELVL